MEEESEGHSDVSDTWSIVDINSEDVAMLIKPESAKTTTASSSSTVSIDRLDECFELTEMTLSSLDPLNAASVNGGFGKKNTEFTDSDTDGISVISDDEEFVNWKKAAHDNYQNTMRLLDESSPINPARITQDLSTPLPTESVEKEIEKSEIEKEEDEKMSEEQTDEVAQEVTRLAETCETTWHQTETIENTWHQNCSNFITKHFFTSAIIAAVTCIALAQFFKTGTGKEKMVEMLEVLEKLKGENEKLQLQLQDLNYAYSTLEAKVMTLDTPSALPNPTAEPSEELPTFAASHRTKDILQLLARLSEKRDPHVVNVVNRLQSHFTTLLEKPSNSDIQFLENKIFHCLMKVIKKNANDENIFNRLTDLEYRLSQKINRFYPKKKKEEELKAGINIVQWYPEEEVSGKENIPDVKITENLVNPEIKFDSTKTKNFKPDTDATYVPNKHLKQEDTGLPVKIETIEKPNEYETKKKSKKRKKKKGKAKRAYIEQIPEEKRFGGNSCEQGRNKTGFWYLERAKGRERIRRSEFQGESRGEWQFARGRRDLRKDADDKATWYFRKFEMHAPSR